MILICSLIFFAITFCSIMLVIGGGTIVFSKDGSEPKPYVPVAPVPAKQTAQPKDTPKLKAYIALNGQFFELHSKAEETKAKKDGYNVVYK
jgi:hypothetical protein